MNGLSKAARIYIASVTAVGLLILTYCLYAASTKPGIGWLSLIGLTAISSLFAVKLDLVKSEGQSLSITLSDVFIFAALLIFGPAVAVLVAATEGAISNYRVRVKALYKQLFNVAQLAVSAFLVGLTFGYMARRSVSPQSESSGYLVTDPEQLIILVFAALFCALLYFVVNSMSVAMAMALATGRAFFALWQKNFLWISPINFANASAAAILFAYLQPGEFMLAAVLGPLAAAIYLAQRYNFYQLKQARKAPITD